MENQNISKSVFPIVILVLVLVGCKSDAAPTTNPTINTQEQQASTSISFSPTSPHTQEPPTQTPVPPTETPMPKSPTPTQTFTPEPLTYWPYPRYDINNTAASAQDRWLLRDGFGMHWDFVDEPNYVLGSYFPVAADLDNDGKAEYVIGRTNFDTQDAWLYAFNVEDGSTLWKSLLDAYFYWSSPVISDVDSDGQLDIVLASASFAGGTRQVMAINGKDGSTIWAKQFNDGGMAMTVADVDNDGWVDIIINDYGFPQSLNLLDARNGAQKWKRQSHGTSFGLPTAADLNGDGYLEIINHSRVKNPSRDFLTVWDYQGNVMWEYLTTPNDEQFVNVPTELGFVPDYGYTAITVADFNADGDLEIGWGTRCHYYLLDTDGRLIWRTPTNVQGYGLLIIHHENGQVEYDDHGTGGFMGYAAAVGNLDNDPALEIVIPLQPEYRGDQYLPGGQKTYQRIDPANLLWALDSQYGTVQWVFEGDYPSDNDDEYMHEPILVDLTGDGLLDVLVQSTDRNLYAIHGETGELLLSSFFPAMPLNWYANHLTFVRDGDIGILFQSVARGSTYVLQALEIAERVVEVP